MKVLLTGAHFTPAQAVIEELKKVPGVEIIYIGRKNTLEGDRAVSLESQVLPKLGVKFYPIFAGRLRRNFDIYTLISLLKIPIGFIQSFYILTKESPDIVLSFGGYVGLPVVISAWVLSIPIIVHEQTLISGLANTISNLFADKVAVSFKKKYSFNSNKLILTGNPIRKEILSPQSKPPKDILDVLSLSRKDNLRVLYITGGNQGSHVINEAVLPILDQLTQKYVVIHQTGDSKFNDYGKLVDQKNRLKYPERYMVVKWFNGGGQGYLLKNVDLAVSRAGVNTLLELSYLKIPTLITPLPFVQKNEQGKNAEYFKQVGLGEVLPQSKLTSNNLLSEIKKMFTDLDRYKESAKLAKDEVVPNASEKLAQEVLVLGSKHV